MESLNLAALNASFLNQYVFDSKAIVLIGFTLMSFLILQGLFIYGLVKHKKWWMLILSNLITAAFTWATTIYLLYPQMVLNILF